MITPSKPDSEVDISPSFDNSKWVTSIDNDGNLIIGLELVSMLPASVLKGNLNFLEIPMCIDFKRSTKIVGSFC
ncbi:MAG: hypothetical protein QM534_17135 [Sediminibacterium sp.]|nr:hypothetical protein [Sediminibacterium sp.]